jgi:hypothetical protein
MGYSGQCVCVCVRGKGAKGGELRRCQARVLGAGAFSNLLVSLYTWMPPLRLTISLWSFGMQ